MKHKEKTIITKTGMDAWLFENPNNSFDNMSGKTSLAVWALDVACNACKMISLEVQVDDQLSRISNFIYSKNDIVILEKGSYKIVVEKLLKECPDKAKVQVTMKSAKPPYQEYHHFIFDYSNIIDIQKSINFLKQLCYDPEF